MLLKRPSHLSLAFIDMSHQLCNIIHGLGSHVTSCRDNLLQELTEQCLTG